MIKKKFFAAVSEQQGCHTYEISPLCSAGFILVLPSQKFSTEILT